MLESVLDLSFRSGIEIEFNININCQRTIFGSMYVVEYIIAIVSDCIKELLSSLYYKYGTIRCLGLHFSDRTVRLADIF